VLELFTRGGYDEDLVARIGDATPHRVKYKKIDA
tara:strand:+ start:1707 stop:1808 length:102 start_codon:yes stop_codon:yes gene_type:complete